MPPTIGPKLILLARHGQTAWNHGGRYQGQSDPPLSASGIREAERLAEILTGVSVGRILSSPLRRARQTASILTQRLGLAGAAIDPNLIEISYGDWEGLTQPAIKQRWPDLLRAWKRTPERVRFPGGEALSDVQIRLRRCLAAQRTEAGCQPVLLVTHSIWIKLALIEVGIHPELSFRQIDIPTSSVHSLTVVQGAPYLQPIGQNQRQLPKREQSISLAQTHHHGPPE